MVGSGFAEVLVRSDNEPAIALKEAVATSLKLAGVAVETEESAPASSHIELLKVQRCGSLRWIC